MTCAGAQDLAIFIRIHAVEEHDRKILRQDEQDELRHTVLSPNGEELFLMPHPLLHPVNPVKIQFFNCIVSP
jgi:hypothetical protein